MLREQWLGMLIMCAIYFITMLGLRWIPWLTGRKRTPSWVTDMLDDSCDELCVDAPWDTKYFMWYDWNNGWWVVEFWMMDYENCQSVDREVFLTRAEAVQWFIGHAEGFFGE